MKNEKLLKCILIPEHEKREEYFFSYFINRQFLDLEFLYTLFSDKKAYSICYRPMSYKHKQGSFSYSVIYIGFDGRHLLLLDLSSNEVKEFHPKSIEKVFYKGDNIDTEKFYANNGLKLSRLLMYLKLIPLTKIVEHFYKRIKL